MTPGQWFVMVEENIGRTDFSTWRLTQQFPQPDRASAMAAAEQTAWRYKPANPLRPEGRSVFRGDGGSYLVTIRGTVSFFHFRVSVMEWLGDAPA